MKVEVEVEVLTNFGQIKVYRFLLFSAKQSHNLPSIPGKQKHQNPVDLPR